MEKTFSYSGFVTGMGFDNPMLVLFNDVGISNTKQIEVVQAKVREASPSINSSRPAGRFKLNKITAASEGDSVQIVKADTLAANLPSQLDIKINSDITASSDILAARIANPIPVSPFASRSAGTRLNIANIWSTQRGEGSTQNLTLAAGQGFAITNVDDNYSQSGTWQLVCVFKVGTDAFYVNTEFYARELPTAYFSIMNNTGSGITVNVVSLEINEIGSALITSPSINAPYVGFKRVEGYDGGEVVTPIARDTQNVLPSTITLRRNRLFHDLKVIDAGSKAGAVNKYAYGYPSSFMQIARAAGLFREQIFYTADRIDKTATAMPASSFQPNTPGFGRSRSQGDFSGVILNPGEGFSLNMMNMSHYASYYVELEFIVRESVALKRPRATLSI